MGLKETIYAKIKEEITNDPQGVGYAGKTITEKLALLNNAIIKQRIEYDTFPPPINRILSGIPDMPNIISLAELMEVLK